MSPAVEVLRTYLELRTPEQLRPARFDDPAVRVLRRHSIDASDCRRLYESVGGPWNWTDRNQWSDEFLSAHLARDAVAVWELRVGGEIAGYFELEAHDDGSVEIAYFGLVAPFMGRGLGKALLTQASEEAWAAGATRVWLHTCTLDSAHALPNYLARGFTVTKQEWYIAQVPDT